MQDAQNYFFPNDDGVNQFVQCITYLQCFTSQQHVCWRPVNQRYKVRDLSKHRGQLSLVWFSNRKTQWGGGGWERDGAEVLSDIAKAIDFVV